MKIVKRRLGKKVFTKEGLPPTHTQRKRADVVLPAHYGIGNGHGTRQQQAQNFDDDQGSHTIAQRG